MRRWLRPLALLASCLLLPGVVAAPPSQAAPPDGLSITSSGTCLTRQGGQSGYRIEVEFIWFYPENAPLGASVRLSGSYAVQIHNPTSGAYETLSSAEYGFDLEPGGRERRATRISPRDPHWVFDQMRLETTWTLEQSGETGAEVTLVDCQQGPLEAGVQPITAPAAGAATPTRTTEVFVHQADPSPYPELTFDTWLICEPRGSGGGAFLTWGVAATNRSASPEEEGITISGTMRTYTRPAGQEYRLLREQTFGQFLAYEETTVADDALEMRREQNPEAARLEVEWRASRGNRLDPAASAQRVLRTDSCRR